MIAHLPYSAYYSISCCLPAAGRLGFQPCLLASRPRGGTFSSKARHTPRLQAGPRLSGRGFRAAWQTPGSNRGRAVQCSSSVAISACWLPGCSREIGLRFRFSTPDQSTGTAWFSSEEEPHIVGTRESGYSCYLMYVLSTGQGLVCTVTAVSTGLGGFFRSLGLLRH